MVKMLIFSVAFVSYATLLSVIAWVNHEGWFNPITLYLDVIGYMAKEA